MNVGGVNMDPCSTNNTPWTIVGTPSSSAPASAASPPRRCLSKHAGKKVLVLERHYTAGGYTHSFHRPGYSWDVGVHYIGELQDPASPAARRVRPSHRTASSNGRRMPDVYDRVVIGGRTFEFPTGLERLRARLKDYFPTEASAIDRYLAAVQSAQKASGLYFAEKAIPRPVARLAGRFLRAPFLRWASQSTLDVLRRFTAKRGTDRRSHRAVGRLRPAARAKQLRHPRHRRRALFQWRELSGWRRGPHR